MQSLTAEIQSFSRSRLRKQCTRVTSLSGRRIIETWKGSTITVVEDPVPTERILGYVSHILNVAFGVENVFPDLFIYKTVSILDHPDADVLLHLTDVCSFIQQAHS
ncbi:hypothetical protein F7725_002533, partial [Dissostichus mawsoni]